MSDSWDDFESAPAKNDSRRDDKCSGGGQQPGTHKTENIDSECSWGQLEADDKPSATARYGNSTEIGSTDGSDFISAYEKYLADKKSIIQQTENYKTYSKNPHKYLRAWFENEGHEDLIPKIEQTNEGQYVCLLELPVKENDFILTSECHSKKKDALDEVCLDACRLLDACGILLVSSSTNQDAEEGEEDPDRKRRIDEANKEDDIEFDSTSKRVRADSSISRPSTTDNEVNTYESLMVKWSAVNMSILQLKSQLVKLDLSVAKEGQSGKKTSEQLNDEKEDEGDEVDPLDAFMSNLGTKTALSMDDKIEKSRLKAQIAAQEKELSKLSRMIEVAKPAGSKQP